jgi:hypothetical protein
MNKAEVALRDLAKPPGCSARLARPSCLIHPSCSHIFKAFRIALRAIDEQNVSVQPAFRLSIALTMRCKHAL